MTTKVKSEFLDSAIISDHSQVTAADADHILIHDASDNTLKKALVSTISSSSAADDITAGDAAVTISTSSGNITIDNASSDDDIIFKGTDGGSDITALTLDMSDAGTAIFNHDIKNVSGDMIIDVVGAVILDADDNGNVSFRDGGTRYGYIEKSSNDMIIKTTLSSAAIRLDTAQNVNLYAAGTHFAYLQNENSDFRIGPIIQDKDFIVRGNDGGTYIDGLTIDFSEAANVTVDSGNLLLGTAGKYIQVAGGSNNYWAIGSTGGVNAPGTASTTFGFHLWNGSAWDQELSLDASGNLTADGNVTAYSDERLKDNIQTLESGLDKVNQLRGVTYTRDEKENIGVVAQEVEKILPQIVLTADDEMGTKSVDYSRLTAVLIEAVKELSAKVKELENK